MPRDVESDDRSRGGDRGRSRGAAGARLRGHGRGARVVAERGAVRVDRLDDEARAGIERSARVRGRRRVARAHDPPVHPEEPGRVPRAWRPDGAGVDEDEVERFLRFFAEACGRRGVTPLIENVPPILRMRTGGVYLSPVGGHWRDLLEWRERIPELGFTLDTSHAALFRRSPRPTRRCSGSAIRRRPRPRPLRRGARAGGRGGARLERARRPRRGPAVRQRRSRPGPGRAAARRARPVHRRGDQRAGSRCSRPSMKAGYRAIERVTAVARRPPMPRPRRRLRPERFDWQRVLGSPTPCRPCSSCRSSSAAGGC